MGRSTPGVKSRPVPEPRNEDDGLDTRHLLSSLLRRARKCATGSAVSGLHRRRSVQPERLMRARLSLQSGQRAPAAAVTLQPAGDLELQQDRSARSAGELPDRRTRSSIATGVGPSRPTIRAALVRARARDGWSGEAGSGSSAGRSIGRPRIGRSTAITSAASVTSVAPCLSRPLVPSARGSSGEPGTANTSRPCSSAMRAVISEPERRAASITTTPSDKPGDQPVAARKIARARLPAERHFGDQRAVLPGSLRRAPACSGG